MWNKLKAALLALTLCLSAAAEEKRLFILHTNDIHGHIEAYEGGGLTRIAAAVKLFREAFPGQVVLLDGGDTSLGTPLSGTFYGRPTAELMAHMKYDAIAVGNHEFNWGKAKMRSLTDAMKVPVLCSNLVTEDGSPPPYPSYTIVTQNGVKIAVIGLVAPDTARRAPAKATVNWNFLPAAQAVEATLPTISEEYDILVTLNHIGVEADQELAKAVPEIDLVVGGHSHTPLHEPVYEGATPIVQAGCYGGFLGVLQLSVDTEQDSLKVLSYQLVPMTGKAVDPIAAAMVEKYAADLRPIMQRKMAEVTEKFSLLPVANTYDTPLGNFIADVFRDQAKTDLAFYNRAGVRFDMAAGPLTVEGVHKLFPFDDPMVILEGSGRQIRQVIEQGTVGGEGPLSPSGLTAKIEDNQVTDIRLGAEPLQDEKRYTLATTLFLASGGDGMSTLQNLRKVKTLPFTRDVLLQYLESQERLTPRKTKRFPID